MDKLGVVIPAAGQGKRMGTAVNKQFLLLNGVPILAHTLKTFQASPYVSEIVIVGAGSELDVLAELIKCYEVRKVVSVCQGGAERQDSVYAGLQALSPTTKRVVVHDGARPLLTLEMFHRFLEQSKCYEAAIMAVPLKDTVKRIDGKGLVQETPPRNLLRAVQTPQIFNRDILIQAHEKARREGFYGTDDASLLEWLGYPVYVVDGSFENIKVTTPDDLWLAERILAQRNSGLGQLAR